MSGESREPGIGRSLERARQSRGLSLWQVEQETRIRSRYLRDLEREDFDVLPAVYVLGSLKTYADFLGLDGATLSRQLKASLVEPDEPDVPAQLAALGETPDEDDKYEAAPVPAVGFDQLFLGMGVILISILAVMTIVAAVAQGDESPVSQINQPSTSDAPSEIALAGNVQDEDGAIGDDEPGKEENRVDQPEKEPESPKDGEKGEDQQAASPFDGVDFVPMPQSSSSTGSASASAVPSSTSSASPGPAPSSPAPSSPASSSPAPSSPASSSPASSSPAPTNAEPNSAPPASTTAAAATEASPRPAEGVPGSASPAPAAAGGGASPQAGGTEVGEPAPSGETEVADQISAEANRIVDEAFEEAGIVR